MFDADNRMTAASRQRRAPTPGANITTSGSAAELLTSGGHVTSTSNVTAMITVSVSISPTTSVHAPVAMGLIGGAPALRFGSQSTTGFHGGTSATRFGVPSAMDHASGGGGHVTTTFGGPPAACFVVGDDLRPQPANFCRRWDSLAVRRQPGNGCHPRPPDANDKRIRAGDELRRRLPGDEYRRQFEGGHPAASGGHHAVSSSYPPSLDLLGNIANHSALHGNVIASPPTTGTTIPTANASTMIPTASCFTLRIAAGDGDLMPPRCNSDRGTDTEDWLQDMINYVTIRRVQPADASAPTSDET